MVVEMSEQDWTEWFAKSFGVFLNGDVLRPGTTWATGTGRQLSGAVQRARRHRLVHAPGSDRGAGAGAPPSIRSEDLPFATGPLELAAGESVDASGLSLLVLKRI